MTNDHRSFYYDVQNRDAAPKPAGTRRRSAILGVAVSAIVMPGIFATLALPAYADVPAGAGIPIVAAAAPARPAGQSFVAPKVVTAAAQATRDEFGATSVATWKHRHALAVAALGSSGAASGASIGAVLGNPPYPHFDLNQVVAVARKYEGVPYVFGGESPAGFDCSGLVAYVYAQFGISLPHSAAAQGAMGTRISLAAARPGDVVVLSGGSHVGIYLGGGRMIDAPEPGRVVSDDAIYTSDYYIVRFGI